MNPRMILGVTAVVLGAGTWSAGITETLPYPYEISPSAKRNMERVQERLEKPCSLEIHDGKTTIEQAIRTVAEEVGVKIHFDVRPEGIAALSLKGIKAKHAIRLLLKQSNVPHKLHLLITETEGSVITDNVEKYPIIEKQRMTIRLSELRRKKFPTPAERAEAGKREGDSDWLRGAREFERWNRRVEQRLRRTRVSRDFEGQSLGDIVAELAKIVDLNLVFEAYSVERRTETVSIRGESRTVRDILRKIGLTSLTYIWSYNEHGEDASVVLVPEEEVQRHQTKPLIIVQLDPDEGKRRRFYEEVLPEQKKYYTVRVVNPDKLLEIERAVLDAEIHLTPRRPAILGNFVKDLAEATRLPVFVGDRAWKAPLVVRREVGMTVGKLAGYLRRKQGLELTVYYDTFFVSQEARFDVFAIYILDPARW